MLFNSFEFILFFAVAVITYYLLPGKVQNLWLLILNYFFYMYFSPRNGLLLLGCTLFTYFLGIGIYRIREAGEAARSARLPLVRQVILRQVIRSLTPAPIPRSLP